MDKLFFGAIKPKGALYDSIQRDIEGCIGNLPALAPDIISKQDIYGADRLTLTSKQAELGRKPDEHAEGEDVMVQYMWWNSESQSNWLDGYLRGGLLLQDEKVIDDIKKRVDKLISTQDDNGYIGIYADDLRYKHTEENGEFWAKSTLFRALLAYYESSNDDKVLQSVLRAADEMMLGYPKDNSNPFDVKNSFSGHGHGLTIVDSLHEIYVLTGKKEYLDYAIWLYENFSCNNVSQQDLKMPNILSDNYIWNCHGVHTFEHLRAVMIAGYYRAEYRPLVDRMFAKLPFYLTPSGGPIGDEWIHGRTANATHTGYEYCSITELFDSYALWLQLTHDLRMGDAMEWLYFNAGLGMKHPSESSIMYCKTDNCYSADRKRHDTDIYHDERYKYSPTHQTTAVCCVPNMGRLTPYYTQNMYVVKGESVTCVLFGESEMTHNIGGNTVTIQQVTNYPVQTQVKFIVTASAPTTVDFGVRVPSYATAVTANREFVQTDNRLSFKGIFDKETTIEVSFACDVVVKTDFCKDYYIAKGPLLYALPIKSERHTLHSYDTTPFEESGYMSLEPEVETYEIHENAVKQFAFTEENGLPRVKGEFMHGDKTIERTMVPLYETILRKVTFTANISRT